MKRALVLAIILAAALSGASAQAKLLQYTISGVDRNAANQTEFASFQIDSDRPIDGSATGIGFYYAAVPGTFTYGPITTTDPQDISFYLDAAHGYDDPGTDPGGLLVGEGDLLEFSGPQLFTGPIEHPTLLTGNFTLIDAFSGSPISLTVAAIPEPASWMMMIGGMAAMGCAVRRRKIAFAAT